MLADHHKRKKRPQGSERGIKYGEAGYSPAAKIPTPYALQASLQIFGRGMRTSSTCALHKCLARKWNFLIITKNRPQGSGGAGYCYAGQLFICAFLLGTKRNLYAALRKIPRELSSLFLLSACGMRHSDGFATLMPSQFPLP